MPRTAEITIDETVYTIRAFNIGELEEIQEAGNSAWKVLQVALRRATPEIVNPRLLEPTPKQITEAFKTIMKLAGLEEVKTGPQLVPGVDPPNP